MTNEDIAARLLAARRDGAPIAAGPQDGPADEAAALAAQALTTAALGPVGGFKTGRKRADAAPLMAPILAAALLADGETPDPAASRLRGVELEIGFRLEGPPPDPDDPAFDAILARRVVALPALEIVESRLADPEAAGPLWKLADNQINGAAVVGAPLRDWGAADLTGARARLSIGGRSVWDGPAPTPGGPAFATFAAFARRIGAHCGGLREGQVVITGSLTGLLWAQAGDAVAGEIDGLGRIGARFA